MYKTLKFRPHLVPLVLSGEKNVTWRLFDDKDIQVGDVFDMLNWETKEKFAEAEAVMVREKPLGAIEAGDLTGHEEFSTRDEMLATYQKYYGDKVDWNTIVKIINFQLL
jgi:hypothetical protein